MADDPSTEDVPHIDDVDKQQIIDDGIEVVKGAYALYDVRWGPDGEVYYVNRDTRGDN